MSIWTDSDRRAISRIRRMAKDIADAATTQLERDAAAFALRSPEAIAARPNEFLRFNSLWHRLRSGMDVEDLTSTPQQGRTP